MIIPSAMEKGPQLHQKDSTILLPPLEHLQTSLHTAAHLLPAQGPITVFIHHNTLHALENLPFEKAVAQAERIFGCEPYLSEERYREALYRGRIRFTELREVLRDDLADRALQSIIRQATRFDLRLAMLQYPHIHGSPEEIRWFIAEHRVLYHIRTDVSAVVRGRLLAETRRWVMRDLRVPVERNRTHPRESTEAHHPNWLARLFSQFRESNIEHWDEATWEAFTLHALWEVCAERITDIPDPVADSPSPPRHRDLLLAVTGVDTDLKVHDLLIRFCAAFLDQGLSHWVLPDRHAGLFRAFCSLYGRAGGPPDSWLSPLPAEIARLQKSNVSALTCLQESLEILGVPREEWESFLSSTALALRGWGGMIEQVETRGDRVAYPIPEGSLEEFFAVRLLLERLALQTAAEETLGFKGSLASLREELSRRLKPPMRVLPEQRTLAVFELAQVLGWTPDELYHLDTASWEVLIREIEDFSSLERRRIFHLAYELRFRRQTLDALSLHRPRPATTEHPPCFQLIACLDEREESFRRHLEEVAPDCETFGAAGFFSVAMYYRGLADAHFIPLCPVVVRPKHWVVEQVNHHHEETHRRRARLRRLIGQMWHRFHSGTRTFALGALLSAGLGALASIPLVMRILFPRLTAKTRHRFVQFIQTPARTRLRIERTDSLAGPDNGHLGFTVEEKVAVAERQLRDIGLTRQFSRLVFILGHGSSSLNNPHKSAYDCGACGGSPGAPNARAIAQILNDPGVRELLANRGISLPSTTHFVGAYHNTCDDSVKLFDLDRVPDSHWQELVAAQRDIEETCERNAHERSRRFMSAPLTQSFAHALAHVENRAEDLAQTRPELGHATNAICVLGRRERTRGLFLDRRAFLFSYDPQQDDSDSTILTRILQAIVPVCSGINLEYYFSHVDSAGWGCGTKLPHNITSLLGVMDGAASDLRTGLPWQMVEIHEPVRLLFIIETTREAIARILLEQQVIGQPFRNGWVQLALLDPHSSEIHLYDKGAFTRYQPTTDHLPQVHRSVDWYRGWRDHLEFAEIAD